MTNDLETLPRLIEQAIAALDGATTAAEVLDARDQAKVAYDAAKSAARFAKAQSAHATILETCHRMQADALTIEARAQSRFADEYDAAQDRGEINKAGKPAIIPGGNNKASVADAGLKPKEIHQARQVRDAETRAPGLIRKTLDAKLEAGEEPRRADVKRAVKDINAAQFASPRGTAAPVSNGHDTSIYAQADPEPTPLTVILREAWRVPLIGTEITLGVPAAEFVDFILRLGINAFNRNFQNGLTNQIEIWFCEMHGKYPNTFVIDSWEGSCGPLSIDKLRARHGFHGPDQAETKAKGNE